MMAGKYKDYSGVVTAARGTQITVALIQVRPNDSAAGVCRQRTPQGAHPVVIFKRDHYLPPEPSALASFSAVFGAHWRLISPP